MFWANNLYLARNIFSMGFFLRFPALVVIALIFHADISAQQIERCAVRRYEEFRIASDPEYASRRLAAAQEIENYARNSSSRFNGEVYRIPVVVHIIYNSEEQNISDDQVELQMERLNLDYRRLNSDASQTRQEFMPVAADAGIEFYLADFDPDGNPTTGITRTETSVGSFWLSLTDMKSESTGGVDAWDVNHYLNIWVCNMAIPFINTPLVLGFATPPEGAPNWPANSGAEEPAQDGVVIHYGVFGPTGETTGPLATVNQGRTATHEIGHYLGLRHIWGDGDCTEDDGLTDTPTAAAASQQTCDLSSNSCTDNPDDLPDMIENYMDYSDENCMNMFTGQQVEAMRFVIENFRQDLLLGTGNAFDTGKPEILVYPNPANDQIQVMFKTNHDEVTKLELRDLSGRIVKEDFNNSTLDVSTTDSGVYMIQIWSGTNYFVHKVMIRH